MVRSMRRPRAVQLDLERIDLISDPTSLGALEPRHERLRPGLERGGVGAQAAGDLRHLRGHGVELDVAVVSVRHQPDEGGDGDDAGEDLL